MPIYDPYSGRYLTQPQASVTVTSQPSGASSGSDTQTLFLLGQSDLAKPQTAISIAAFADLATKLGGGSLAQAAALAFSASPLVTTVPQITCVDVSEKTQATDTSTFATSFTVSANYWGGSGNYLKYMLQPASGGVGYKVFAGSDYASSLVTPSYVSKDNVYQELFTVYYIGTDTSPQITISDTTVTVQGTSGGSSTTIVSVTLTPGMTLGQLITALGNSSKLVVTLTPTASPSQVVYAYLDNLSAVPVGTSSATATPIYANVSAVVSLLNSSIFQPWITATRVANAVAPTADSTWHYLSGGATTAPANTDWQNGFNFLESVSGVGVVCPLTSTTSIWAMGDAHAAYMTSIYQPRVNIVGDAVGASLETELTNAANLNSARTIIRFPGFVGTNLAGNLQTFDSFYEAARTGAIMAAAPPTQSITLVPVTAVGLEQTLTQTDIDSAIEGGVCVTKVKPDGSFRIADDVTTYTATNQFNLVKSQVERELDVIAADLQAELEAKLVGFAANNGPSITTLATSVATSRLDYWTSLGYLVGKPSYQNLTATAVQPNAVSIQVQVFPAQANDFVLMNVQAAPYQG